MKRDILDALLTARAGKTPVALATRISDGAQALVFPDRTDGDDALAGEITGPARESLRANKSGTIETEAGDVFVQVFNPPLRMIVVGAVHIAQALAPIAGIAGYQVTVVDPRRAFAAEPRFPGVDVADEWPDKALTALAPDRRTAVVTLTHDPKLDDPALQVALRSDAFYIGSLGSKKTHAARLKRLEDAGFDETERARIHGPVGLAIGARSPAEIAVSILAEITQVLHDEAAT